MQSTTITGTFSLAGNYTSNSLDASNAMAFNFTSGNLTLNGGIFKPLLSTIAGYSNSTLISSPAGTNSVASLTLENGASATALAWFIGSGGGSAAVVITGANSTLGTNIGTNELFIGYGGTVSGTAFVPSTGTLTVANGGNASSGGIFEIGGVGGIGFASVSSANSSIQANSLYVGYGQGNITAIANGTLSISNGGLVTGSQVYIGYGAIGNATVNGVKTLLSGGNITVGQSVSNQSVTNYLGTGTLTVMNGAKVLASRINIGAGGGIGNILVDGANSTIQGSSQSSAFQLTIGNGYHTYVSGNGNVTTFSIGTLSVTNGGHAAAYSEYHIGFDGGIGTVTIDGANSTLQGSNPVLSPNLFVGWNTDASVPYVGNATLNITNGGVVTCGSAVIAQTGAYANVTVSGANSALQCVKGGLFFGYDSFPGKPASVANLSISNGGTVSSSVDTNIGVGNDIALVTLNNATLSAGGNLTLGIGSSNYSIASAVLAINSGGLVTVGKTTETYGGNNTVAIKLNGGTLQTASLTLGNSSHLQWTSGTLSITGTSGFASSNLGTNATLATGETLRVTAALNIPSGDTFSLVGGAATTSQLSLGGSTGDYTSTLNFNSSGVLIVEASTNRSAAIAALRDEITYGKTHSTGITASALSLATALAVIDNGTLLSPFKTFGGVSVDNYSILITPERLGDVNVDGAVDLNDLNTVLNNLGTTSSAWTSGNFDGAATIDLNDLNDVLNNLGVSYAGNATVLAAEALIAATPTPEPGSLAILALAPLAMRRRKLHFKL